MNEALSDASTSAVAVEATEIGASVNIVLSAFPEANYRRLFRFVCVLAVAVVVALFLWWAADAPGGWFYGLLVFLISLSGGLLDKRSISVTNVDVGTAGGRSDVRISWESVDSIRIVGQVVEFRFLEGGSRSVSLKVLPAVNREDAATSIIRCFEMFRHAGPLLLPLNEELVYGSERLEIRPLRLSDLEFVVELFTASDRIDRQLSVETSKELVALSVSETFRKGSSKNSYGRLVICHEGTPIGMIYLAPTDLVLRIASLGIDILPAFCNRGFGTEAVVATLAFFAAASNLTKISAGCFSDNHTCRRMLERAGMTYLGTQHRFWFKGGAWKEGELFEYLFKPPAGNAAN